MSAAAKRWALGLGILACVGLLALTLVRVAERGRFARPFSSYGAGGQGTRALYLLLSELGYPVVRWSQDLARLPSGATLIALGSCESATARELSRLERDELLTWLERGGVLIVAGARNYLPQSIGLGFEDDAACDVLHGEQNAPPGKGKGEAADEDLADLFQLEPHAPDATDNADAVWGVPTHAGLEGLPIVRFRKPPRLQTDALPETEVLLGLPPASDTATTELQPLAVMRERGRGRVIVLASANMLQNAELESSEGATLFVRLLRAYGNPKLLIFDEYHLGLGERRSLMQYLRESGAMPVLCQLLCIALVVLRRAGARLGAPQPPPRNTSAPARNDTETAPSFVAALGSLYERVEEGDPSGALRLIVRAALVRISKHYALGTTQPSELVAALEQRGAMQAAEAVRHIMAAGSSKKGALPLVQSVERIDAALAALHLRS